MLGSVTNENSSLLVDSDSPMQTSEAQTDNHNTETEESKNSKERALESYLKFSGLGLFHVVLVLVSGLATAADAVEIFGVSFVVPVAEDDLGLSTSDKGWLQASIFVGMLIGGYTWGSLADVFGRKPTLMTAMLFNGLCGLISSFSPNFAFFLAFRLASGIGVGGSQPIVFSYVSEFFTEKQKGPVIIILASCWQPGIIFTALLAWGLMGIEGAAQSVSFYIGSLHFVNWRLFLVICTLPALLSAFSLLFMPETPAYLMQAKRLKDLKKVLKKIERINKTCGFCWCQREEGYEIESLLNENLELDYESTDESDNSSEALSAVTSRSSFKMFVLSMKKKFLKILSVTAELFRHHYIRATLVLLIIWFTQSYGYYGLQLWFPEYFKRLLEAGCELENVTLNSNDCTNETNLKYYQDTLYTAIASLPGNIAGTLLINVIGGQIQLVGAMLLSTLSVFLIWSVPSTNGAVVGVSCIFSAVTVTVFGSLDVILMNIYGVQVRSTAFGVHSGVGRIGAILGNVMFGHLLDVDRAIPIIAVASLLLVGALSAMFLPPVYRPENQPPLERLLDTLKSKCKSLLCPCIRRCSWCKSTDSTSPSTTEDNETRTLCTSM